MQGGAEAEANARLIAAAPDLLQILDEIINVAAVRRDTFEALKPEVSRGLAIIAKIWGPRYENGTGAK